jgi:hypothetical protein
MKPLFFKQILPLFWVFSFSGIALAQAPDYPKNYFRNPLGIPILLAGNFGECRPGHFHSGIDIKTGGKENLPVYAAADGYVSRIKMEPGGFGHGLYITHPNGYTTLYAHLNNFMPALQQYVRQQQYATRSWTADLSLSPNQFPVKKGQQIAFSGNTGGSTAPHLHFEIRDARTDHPLNPQLFGFAINDTRAPVPLKLAVYDRSRSIYMAEPRLFALKGTNGIYRLAKDTLNACELTGIGLVVNDFMTGSENTLAFYTAEWLLDGQLQGRIRLNDIGYDETRYLHAYADYKAKRNGPWIQCLFRLKGNNLDRIYEALNARRGVLDLSDNRVHRLEIRLTDAAGNTARVQCQLRNGGVNAPSSCNDVVDAARGLTVDQPGLRFSLGSRALYDDVCNNPMDYPHYPTTISGRHQVLDASIPAHHSFSVSLKPITGIPFDLRSKIVMRYRDGQKESGQAALQEDKGWYKSTVRAFGEYRLEVDTTAPVVTPSIPVKGNLAKAKKINFVVKDAMTSVQAFSGELDGKWILFEQHENNWFYELDNHCPKGAHRLVVKATDENGNTATQSYNFTR